jgi:hypothetical protein
MSFRRKTKRDPEFVKNQEQFKQEVLEKIASNSDKRDVLLEYFLESVLPKTEYNYYLFVKSKGGIPINIRYKYEDYIKALIAITDFEVEAYYFPVAFSGWRDNNGTMDYYKCIYIDIDHIDINPLNMTSNEIAEYLKDTYKIPDKLLPQLCVASGGGIHCVWLTEDIFDSAIRDKITQSMITYMGGDHAAFPKSHPFRVPHSFNCKRETPTKSKLMKLSDNCRYNVSDLNFFNKTEEEIDKYFIQEKAKTTAKRLETLAKNKENGSAPSKAKAEEKTTYKRCRDKSDYDSLPNTTVRYYSDFKPKNRYKNLLGDLQNYFYFRDGIINGYRHTFIFIIANYARIFMSENECIEHCSKYVNDSFKDEMLSIIESVYRSDYTYYYNYATIAKLLDFNEFDLKTSYCSFSDEIKREKKKAYNKAYYRRKKEIKEAQLIGKRSHNECMVELYIDRPAKEIAELTGLSLSSVYRIRKKLLA